MMEEEEVKEQGGRERGEADPHMTHNMTHNMTHTHTQMVAEVTVYETQFKYSSYLCRLHVLMYAVVHTHTQTHNYHNIS